MWFRKAVEENKILRNEVVRLQTEVSLLKIDLANTRDDRRILRKRLLAAFDAQEMDEEEKADGGDGEKRSGDENRYCCDVMASCQGKKGVITCV